MSVPEDLLDLYFSELGEVPLLTAEEERARAGDRGGAGRPRTGCAPNPTLTR